MKSKNLVASLVVSFSLFQAASVAADSTDTKIEFGGMAAIENGQFVKSNYAGSSIPYQPWINDEYARISLRATLSEHLQLIIAPEIRVWFDNYNWTAMTNDAFQFPWVSHTDASLANAQGILSYGDKEHISFEFAAGIMPYKYDLEAKNLGEYLFRSETHPAYIVTSFDNAYATLTGFRLSSTMFNKLSMDLFLTTETMFLPTLDWSISFLAGYKPFPCLDIGAGIMLDRLLGVDSLKDRPIAQANGYVTSAGDSGYFSFGGTKVMARVCFDPKEALKNILPSSVSNMFGKEDWKIYGEAAILGIKNIAASKHPLDGAGQPILTSWIVDSSKNYYSDITQRIPVMFGFNIPAFKLLDFLSVELEWFGWPYPQGCGNVDNFSIEYPIPPPVQDASDPLLYTEHDNWKYSFNFKKTIVKGFSIIGQVARDHTHYDVSYAKYLYNTGLCTEAFSQKNEWGWWCKLLYYL
ncbi:MAG: hypothetical protein ABSF80_12865 [Chitinispirillaceae bacterium]|jgi:hypothetical protein